jgi:hypothetical protein
LAFSVETFISHPLKVGIFARQLQQSNLNVSFSILHVASVPCSTCSIMLSAGRQARSYHNRPYTQPRDVTKLSDQFNLNWLFRMEWAGIASLPICSVNTEYNPLLELLSDIVECGNFNLIKTFLRIFII